MVAMQSPNKNNRVRILINALSARQGGGQTYLLNLLKYVPKEYNDLDIAVLAPSSLTMPIDYPYITRIPVKWPVENPIIRVIWEKLCLPGLLRQLATHILFCPGGVLGTRTHRDCKTVTMFRNMIPFDTAQRKNFPLGYIRARLWILQKVLLRSMLRADLVIFISEYAKQVIERHARGRLPRTEVIPHGIGAHFRMSHHGKLPRPEWLPTQEYFLYVSLLDVYKAQIEVVQGFALLKKLRTTTEKLILVGPENRKYGRRLREEINRLKLDDDVLLIGNIPYDQLPSIYHHAKLNIFASECENCPNILLEALGSGRPLFVSNRPPMPEFGGDAVIYFDPARPDMFAKEIAAVIDDPYQMNALASKAKIRSDRYQWEETAKRTWKLIRDLHYLR